MTAAAGKCVMTTTMVTTTLLHSRHIVDDLESMQRIKPSMQLAKVSITVHSSRRPQFGRRLSSVQQFRGDKEVRADSTSIAGRCLPSTNISKELVFPHQFVLRTPQSRVFPDKEIFLRVLHIENSDLEGFSPAIGGCIHLRCLRLRRCGNVTLPSSIEELLYLQIIDLRKTNLDSTVPNSLWNIPTLRHVYLSSAFSSPRSVGHKDLQTLWLTCASAGTKYRYHDMVKIFRKMRQLTTLFLVMKPMHAKIMNIFAYMPHLVDIHLASFGVLDKLPESNHFPQSLRHLYLEADVIEIDPMPILEKLPCLVVLELSGYKGRTMSFSAQGFPRLTLWLCKEMWKFPSGLLHLPSLKNLKLMSKSLISGDDSTLKELERRGCKVEL
ncbi:unnamed protein product [Triticum turgidum subsp. durum]|uniref:Disease resistance R13L4/SHOC-2-like LRR domain-containing protein n=1 Tax=Triticum turgidum subsp. durum TaxID=4567 RepID=A0A9R1R3Q6_TRITD|nr:unnamed protein product [Triticum turgidum subsp. durum]